MTIQFVDVFDSTRGCFKQVGQKVVVNVKSDVALFANLPIQIYVPPLRLMLTIDRFQPALARMFATTAHGINLGAKLSTASNTSFNVCA